MRIDALWYRIMELILQWRRSRIEGRRGPDGRLWSGPTAACRELAASAGLLASRLARRPGSITGFGLISRRYQAVRGAFGASGGPCWGREEEPGGHGSKGARRDRPAERA